MCFNCGGNVGVHALMILPLVRLLHKFVTWSFNDYSGEKKFNECRLWGRPHFRSLREFRKMGPFMHVMVTHERNRKITPKKKKRNDKKIS